MDVKQQKSKNKGLLLCYLMANCNTISYLASWVQEDKNLYKWFQSADQDGCHV